MLCVLIRIASYIKKKITQNYPKSAAMDFCSKGLKNEIETAMVNKPSVFEPLKFYCICTEKLLGIKSNLMESVIFRINVLHRDSLLVLNCHVNARNDCLY